MRHGLGFHPGASLCRLGLGAFGALLRVMCGLGTLNHTTCGFILALLVGRINLDSTTVARRLLCCGHAISGNRHDHGVAIQALSRVDGRNLFCGTKPEGVTSRGLRTHTVRLGCSPAPRMAGTAICRARCSRRVSAMGKLG